MTLDYAKKEKNILYLYLDCSNGSSGTIELNSEIICQTLILKSIRVHFVNEGLSNNTANQRLHLKIGSIFGPQQIANNIDLVCLPILSDTTKHDSTWNPNIGISMTKPIPKKLKWSIVNYDNTSISSGQLTFVQVIFEYEIDKI